MDNLSPSIEEIVDNLQKNLGVDNICVSYLLGLYREAQAIVDKLPKCWRLNGQGDLVQDVRITAGMVLYRSVFTNDDGTPRMDTVKVIGLKHYINATVQGKHICPPADSLCVSQAAAEAAQKAKANPAGKDVE